MKDVGIWAARDSNGTLMLYVNEKPVKGKLCWHISNYEENSIVLPKELLPEVMWSNKEPTRVNIGLE